MQQKIKAKLHVSAMLLQQKAAANEVSAKTAVGANIKSDKKPLEPSQARFQSGRCRRSLRSARYLLDVGKLT